MAAPTPNVCIEKERLLREFMIATVEYHRLHSAKLSAYERGDAFQGEDELLLAEARREVARYAVLQHKRTHGC